MKFVCRGEINFPSTSESADWLPLPRLFVGSPYKYQSTWFPILFIFPQCIIILHGHFDRSWRFIIILLLCTSYLLCLCHAGSAPHATQLKGGSDTYILSRNLHFFPLILLITFHCIAPERTEAMTEIDNAYYDSLLICIIIKFTIILFIHSE